MSSALKIMLAFPLIGAALAFGLFVYAKIENKDRTDPEQTTDLLLKQLQLLNPQLRIEDEFTRLPVYWIRAPGSSRKIMLPKPEAAGAKINLQPCDLTAIPPHLLYPNRTEMACLEISNDTHNLSAFFFRTKDSLKKVVDFYEAPLDRTRRFGTSRSNDEERREEDKSRAFLFSYLLHQSADLVGFVGYREGPK
jgi:hypothetical protein